MMALRDYQRRALDALLGALRAHRSALLTLPTGAGKTVVMAELVRLAAGRGRRVLLLAHREELLAQAAEKFMQHVPGVRVRLEQACARVDMADVPDVVVASVQTLARANRLARFAPDAFALVLVDEAHHAVAEGYRRVLAHFGAAKVVGVTATADRLDGAPLGQVFACAPFTYSIRDGIGDGWLVPIRQRRVVVESLDLSRVRTTAGDLNAADLERELVRDQVLHEVAAPLVELAGARQTLVFAVAVSQAHALAELIGVYGGRAAALDGAMPRADRRTLLERFTAGELQYLVNVGVLTEGFDAPIASCVAVARPTKSRALYTQIVGRGTRVLPGLVDQLDGAAARRAAIASSTKPHCLVLDFTSANAGRHTLVSSIDVLAGTRVDDATRKHAERIAREQPDLDAGELLDAAQADAALETAGPRRAKARARYSTQELDPFEVLGLDPKRVAIARVDLRPATAAQCNLLMRWGLKLERGLDRGHATALLEQVQQRRAEGRCTIKQALQLARRGLNPDVSFEDAREALDALAANGWRMPPSLRADPRFATRSSRGAA
jgi:superfamily II DNA or RNA helicase